MFARRKYQAPQNHQYHCNAIPHFSFVYYVGNVRVYLASNIFGENYRLHVIHPDQHNGMLRVSLECAFGLHCLSLLSIPCLLSVRAQRSGTHLVRIHWKLFCRNEYEKTHTQTIFYDVKYPKTVLKYCWKFRTILKYTHTHRIFNTLAATIHSIGNFSCVIFFSFRFLLCRNIPKMV